LNLCSTQKGRGSLLKSRFCYIRMNIFMSLFLKSFLCNCVIVMAQNGTLCNVADSILQTPLRRSLKVQDPSRAAVLVPVVRICQPAIQDDPLSQWGLLYTKRTAHLVGSDYLSDTFILTYNIHICITYVYVHNFICIANERPREEGVIWCC
jgi:hypothetical protein